MSKLEFVSHESFPEDEYIKELVYLCLEGKYRVAYVRKKAKNGGLFWGVPTVGISKNGAKEYFSTFMQDSNFLEQDIKNFLEKRSWEGHRANSAAPDGWVAAPKSMGEVAEADQMPF